MQRRADTSTHARALHMRITLHNIEVDNGRDRYAVRRKIARARSGRFHPDTYQLELDFLLCIVFLDALLQLRYLFLDLSCGMRCVLCRIMYIYMHVFMYVYVYVYVYIYIYIYVYMYIYIYIYIYIHGCTPLRALSFMSYNVVCVVLHALYTYIHIHIHAYKSMLCILCTVCTGRSSINTLYLSVPHSLRDFVHFLS
jgi:hypothetical protein